MGPGTWPRPTGRRPRGVAPRPCDSRLGRPHDPSPAAPTPTARPPLRLRAPAGEWAPTRLSDPRRRPEERPGPARGGRKGRSQVHGPNPLPRAWPVPFPSPRKKGGSRQGDPRELRDSKRYVQDPTFAPSP